MDRGHRGANHPVKDLPPARSRSPARTTALSSIPTSLPAGVEPTHLSLFDKTNEGLSITGKPVFSVQHHPEASPGPQDSHYLFERFIGLMEAGAR